LTGVWAKLDFDELDRLIAEGLDATADAEYAESAVNVAVSAPPGPATLLEFFDVPTGDAFDIAPDDAIALFKAKKLKPTFSYADMVGKAHMQSFTVAKMMDIDMLGQVRASLESAMANGTSFGEWSDGLIPMLQGAGWWGRKEVVDPLTGQTIVAELGSPRRLETIFRTNMQSAYAEQNWEMIADQSDVAPFLMYDAVDDHRTRPWHKERDNTILPQDHPWWNKNYPPLGYNCRCGVIQLSAEELEALGKLPNTKPPKIPTYEWTNPRTGAKHTYPEGIDPGFDYNVGKLGLQKKLDKLLAEKLASLPQDMQISALKSLSKKPTAAAQIDNALDAAKAAAAKAEIEAKAAAAAQRAAEKAAAAAKEAEAESKLKEIAGYPSESGPGKWLKRALTQLEKIPGFFSGPASARLSAVEGKAAAMKANYELLTILSGYKKAVLAGKTPTPKQKKAFDSLSADEQDVFLGKIDKEKAAQAAKKAADEAAAAKAAEDAAKAAAPPQPPPVAPVAGPAPNGPDMENMVQIGPQKGSNPGGMFQDTTTGDRWYIKTPASEDIARNEVLAAKFYEAAGIEVPELRIVMLNGKPSVASRIVDGLEKGSPADLAKASGTYDGFMLDAWLANWDVIGLGYDNLLLKAGRAIRVDTGGALRYRAQGGLKGDAFGPRVSEIDTLRNPGDNSQAASVFGKMSKTDLEAAARRVARISDDDIRAIIAQHGPLDQGARDDLARILIARRKDILDRYKAAQEAEAPAPVADAGAKVTSAEQQSIEASRLNGYAIRTDVDEIEDQNVLINLLKDSNGEDLTRASLKLRESASARLLELIKESGVTQASAGESVNILSARAAMLQAVKGINLRASQGANFDPKDLQRVIDAASEGRKAVEALKKALLVANQETSLELDRALKIFERWIPVFDDLSKSVVPGAKAVKIDGKFPSDLIPSEVIFTRKIVAAEKPKSDIAWRRLPYFEAELTDIQKGYAKATGQRGQIHGINEAYEGVMPDGRRIVFIANTSQNYAWAMRGQLYIDVKGKGAAVSARAMDTIEELKINAARAADIDRQNLYLNRYAHIMFARRAGDRAAFEKIDKTKSGEDAVQAKLQLIKERTGVDVEKSEEWAQRDGKHQAFGHGEVHQYRPDFDTPEFRSFAKTHYVYHNPTGLSKTRAGGGVAEKFLRLVDSGGHLSSLTDRIRRGVALRGTSVESDLNSGGGSYIFTRIKSRRSKKSAGFYWKADVLKRMDAITYDSDMFGNTTPGFIENNRRGQTVEDLKSVSENTSDETIFKHGLSLFDDIDSVVFSSEAEWRNVMETMRSLGYSKWPDGRELSEVLSWEA